MCPIILPYRMIARHYIIQPGAARGRGGSGGGHGGSAMHFGAHERFENKRALNGDWFIWLPHDVLAKLNHLRGAGDSYSDVILALAEATESR
jgi:hypothetical protein